MTQKPLVIIVLGTLISLAPAGFAESVRAEKGAIERPLLSAYEDTEDVVAHRMQLEALVAGKSDAMAKVDLSSPKGQDAQPRMSAAVKRGCCQLWQSRRTTDIECDDDTTKSWCIRTRKELGFLDWDWHEDTRCEDVKYCPQNDD